MTWGFSLLGALLLLFPGFGFWLGFRVGSHQDYLSPVPDKPNSTFTLVMILMGAMLAHVLGAGLFAAQHAVCAFAPCIQLEYDPNIYKAILSQPSDIVKSDLGIELGLFFNFVLGAIAFYGAQWMGQQSALQNILKPDTQGWIKVIADGAKSPEKVVTAFVVTKLGNAGFYAAYEGIVQQLTLDEEQAVTMIVLAGVDRFAVKIDASGLHRVDQEEARSMPLMHFVRDEIANIAFEVVDLAALDLKIDALPEAELLASYENESISDQI